MINNEKVRNKNIILHIVNLIGLGFFLTQDLLFKNMIPELKIAIIFLFLFNAMYAKEYFLDSTVRKGFFHMVYFDVDLSQKPLAHCKLYPSIDVEFRTKQFKELVEIFVEDFFKNRPILVKYNNVSQEDFPKIRDYPGTLKIYDCGKGDIKVLMKSTDDAFYIYAIIKKEEVTQRCNLVFDVFMELITGMTDDEEIIKAADEGKQPQFRVEYFFELRGKILFTVDEKYLEKLEAYAGRLIKTMGFGGGVDARKKDETEYENESKVRMTIDVTNSIFPKPIVEVGLKTNPYFDSNSELLNEISYRALKNIIGTLPIILEVDGKISKYGSVAYDIENRDKKIIGGYRDADGETICYILDFQREMVSQKYAPYCFKVYPEVDISGMSDEEITECYRSGQALGLPFKAWSNGNGEVIMTFDGRYLEDVKGIVKSAVGELRVKGEITTKRAE